MSIRPHILVEDLTLTHSVGLQLLDPTFTFTRILALLSARERVRILQGASDEFRRLLGGPHEFYLEQFVALALYGTFGVNESFRHWRLDSEQVRDLAAAGLPGEYDEYMDVVDKWDGKPWKVHLRDLPDDRDRQVVKATCSGESPVGLAGVLGATVFPPEPFMDSAFNMHEEFLTFFQSAIGRTIDKAEHASAMVATVAANERRKNGFLVDADVVLADAEIFPVKELRIADLHSDVISLRRDVKTLIRTLPQELLPITEAENYIVMPDRIAQHFQIQREPACILVPIKRGIIVARSLSEVIDQAKADKKILFDLNPRDFEKVIGELFRSQGFEVEQCRPGADGGVDLLCMRYMLSAPFRIAVQVKRYKEGNPINVELVRAFVGANQQFNAHRLLYVTTSHYTKPALEYASKYCEHLLSLRDYDAIQEWCIEYLKSPNRVIF